MKCRNPNLDYMDCWQDGIRETIDCSDCKFEHDTTGLPNWKLETFSEFWSYVEIEALMSLFDRPPPRFVIYESGAFEARDRALQKAYVWVADLLMTPDQKAKKRHCCGFTFPCLECGENVWCHTDKELEELANES